MTARKQTKSGARKSKKLHVNKKTLKDLGPRGTGPQGGAARRTGEPEQTCEGRGR